MENIEKVNGMNVGNMIGDALKLAANASEMAKNVGGFPKVDDDSNNSESNPNQTVSINIGGTAGVCDGKSVSGGGAAGDGRKIYFKRTETKPAKVFPDGRALTEQECNLQLETMKMNQEYRMRELEYQQYANEQARKDRLAREELKRKQQEKRNKVRNIIGGVLAALGAVGIGYGIYADRRDFKQNQTMSHVSQPIHTEGSVK